MSSGSSTGTWFWAFTVPVSPDAKSRFITKAAAVGHLHGIFGVTNCTTQSWKLLNDTMSSPLSTTRSASAPFQPWTPLAIFGLLHQPSCIAAEQFFFWKKTAWKETTTSHTVCWNFPLKFLSLIVSRGIYYTRHVRHVSTRIFFDVSPACTGHDWIWQPRTMLRFPLHNLPPLAEGCSTLNPKTYSEKNCSKHFLLQIFLKNKSKE